MKPFFCVDITNNKYNKVKNGDEFIAQRLSHNYQTALDNAVENTESVKKKAELPTALSILHFICGITAGILTTSIICATINAGIVQCYKNAWFLFYIDIVAIVVWLVLQNMSNKLEVETYSNTDNTSAFDSLTAVADMSFTDLGVPPNASDVDILSFSYKVKNFKIVPVATMFPICNEEFKVYSDGVRLYLAKIECKYAFEISKMRAIRTINKAITAHGWHKDEDAESEKYKEHRLKTNDYNFVMSKPYYALEVEHNGELWWIFFPKYELALFEQLTGLKAC